MNEGHKLKIRRGCYRANLGPLAVDSQLLPVVFVDI